jgi:hypothetical protein
MSDVSVLRSGASCAVGARTFLVQLFGARAKPLARFLSATGSTSVYRCCYINHHLHHLESIRVLTEKQLASHKRHEYLPVSEGGRATGHDAHHSPQTDSMHCPSATVRISCKPCFELTDDLQVFHSIRSLNLPPCASPTDAPLVLLCLHDSYPRLNHRSRHSISGRSRSRPQNIRTSCPRLGTDSMRSP